MKYLFYVEKADGSRIEWKGLSETAAKSMYRLTQKHCDNSVTRFGWKEYK